MHLRPDSQHCPRPLPGRLLVLSLALLLPSALLPMPLLVEARMAAALRPWPLPSPLPSPRPSPRPSPLPSLPPASRSAACTAPAPPSSSSSAAHTLPPPPAHTCIGARVREERRGQTLSPMIKAKGRNLHRHGEGKSAARLCGRCKEIVSHLLHGLWRALFQLLGHCRD